MRLLEIAQQVSVVWQQWKQENPRLTDPTVVNNGYCAEFAIEVGSLVPNVVYWSNMTEGCEHVFVEHGGRFYDAECLQGVANYNQLPIWQRIADLQDITPEQAASGSRAVTLEQLCDQYNFNYPPTK
jgi:hypothetical protein